MNELNDLKEFLKGKKTYIVAIAIVVLGALQGLDVFVLPEWAWPIVAALGLTTLRAGVNKVSDTIKEK